MTAPFIDLNRAVTPLRNLLASVRDDRGRNPPTIETRWLTKRQPMR